MAGVSNSSTGTSAGSSIMPGSTQLQRSHMKEAWHIYNIKRRMASLPPISCHVFSTQIAAQTVPTIAADDSTDSDSDGSICSDSRIHGEPSRGEEVAFSSSSHCIFCENRSSALDQNLIHMSSIHSFHIPNIAHLTDLGSFVDYLGILVLRYHECLYCGHTKRSIQGVRQHMSAKGHCSINLDLDPALLDFWEVPGSDDGVDKDQTGTFEEKTLRKPRKLSDTKTNSASHIVVSPRSGGSNLPDSTDEQYRPSTNDEQRRNDQRRWQQRLRSQDRQVAARGSMGLLGVHEQQKRALRVTEKRMMKQEIIARAQQRWAIEKVANKQKHFKSDVPGRLNG